MTTFVIIFLMFVSMFALMTVGVILKRNPITGSCGGLANVGVEKTCDCDKPCEKRLQKLSVKNNNQRMMEESTVSFLKS